MFISFHFFSVFIFVCVRVRDESEGGYFYSADFSSLFMTQPGRVCTGPSYG